MPSAPTHSTSLGRTTCRDTPHTGALGSLTKLDVSLNALKSLPAEVAGLASLRTFFSLGNQFEEVPASATLPHAVTASFAHGQRL